MNNVSQDEVYQDIVISMLAINAWPLYKVSPLADKMREHGLFTYSDASNLQHDVIIERFMAAGYDRRPYMNDILSERLRRVALWARDGGLEEACKLLRAAKRAEADEALLGVYGFGRASLQNFWLLQDEGADG
jgi:hypothetical protein